MLTVLGRRTPVAAEQPVDLRNTHLRAATLDGANLTGARLDGANLTGARLDAGALTESQIAAASHTDLISWLPPGTGEPPPPDP